jgi:hypothetical protein
MRILKSVGIAAAAFFAAAMVLDMFGVRADPLVMLSVIAGIAAGLWFHFRPRVTDVVAETARKYQAVTEEVGARLQDDADAQYYAIAEAEVDAGKADPGLWSQALIAAKGVEAMRKVEYLKLRARQLRRERKQQGQS